MFRWRTDDGPTLNAGLVALSFFRGSGPVLLRNHTCTFFYFSGGGGVRTPPPSGSAHDIGSKCGTYASDSTVNE